MEHGDVFLSGDGARSSGDAPQSIHNLCDINAVGAPGAAGMTGSAQPYGLRGKHLIPMAVLQVPEHLVGQDIHREVQRAPGRTLLALITVLNFLSALLNNFRQQGHIVIYCLLSRIHRLLQF
jgi:hypothetical protein